MCCLFCETMVGESLKSVTESATTVEQGLAGILTRVQLSFGIRTELIVYVRGLQVLTQHYWRLGPSEGSWQWCQHQLPHLWAATRSICAG